MGSAGEIARCGRRPVGALLVVLALLVCVAGAQGADGGSVGASIDQCANGQLGIGDCTGAAWISGNLNENKSLYKGGDFVPFRAQITNLTAGRTYTLRIGYDAVEGGLHAYDYLGSFDATENAVGQRVDPCDGTQQTSGPHACGTAPSTVQVPVDDSTKIPYRTQIAGNFSAWGGALSNAVYVSPTPIDVNTTGTIERQVDVTFTADGDTVVLAWGGHIASGLDWGGGETFVGNGSGSPFHMRLHQIQESGGGTSSTGQMDLQIQAGVIQPVPSPFDTSASPQSVAIGATVVETASLGGQGAQATGTVDFYVCFDANSTPDCSSGGNTVGPTQVVAFPSGPGTAAISYVPTAAGHYCFRAEYKPSDVAPYSPGAHTNTTTECFDATIAPPGPPTLTVTKTCTPAGDGGHFNLTVDGKPVLANTPCGTSTGPIQSTAGAHTVGETAGAGTVLTDYTSGIGGACAADGSITLRAGDNAICTIANVRKPLPTATLKVNKVCKPTDDPGLFDVFVDSTRFPDVACGDTTGAVSLPVGKHTVREAPGTGTALADYTSVIGGACGADGSVTLTADQTAVCTITNTRRPPQPTTLTVNKVCVPPGDSGKFDLRIDGATAKSNVGCGGTTGVIKVSPGMHDVDEAGAGSTDLSDYRIVISGDCNFSGEVFLQAGGSATCEITNIHKQPQPAPFATLSVNKICVPRDDGGRFDLKVDEQAATDEPCGGTFGPLVVPVGSHKVSEAAGSGTKLSDYTTTIGGDCASNGSVTLTAGEVAICTITNVRSITPPTPTPTPTPTPSPSPAPSPTPTPTPTPTPEPEEEPTATLTVTSVCIPANGEARFAADIDNQDFPGLACHDSTGPIVVSVGTHVVGDVATSKTNPYRYRTVYRGSCSANGTIRLKRHAHGRCVIVHIRQPLHTSPSPPKACYSLVVGPRTVSVGRLRPIVALVAIRGKPVRNVQVELTGAGISAHEVTPAGGRARFALHLTKPGVLVIRTKRQYGCPPAATRRLGVIVKRTPPVTG